ncbi:MAG TPA: TRAP transporter fused permease subunit [Burkholderiales bacterium]|nr:TRAP transporter fused permease subunit [Burkholderiales bacterium]
MVKDAQRGKFLTGAILVVGVAMFLYHMAASQVALLSDYQHQDLHLGFLLTLLFLGAVRDAKNAWSKGWYALLLIVGVAATAYVFFNIEHLEAAVGFPSTLDIVVGIALIVVVIEGTRRAWGIVLPLVAIVFMAYFFFGYLLPSPFYHREFGFGYIISYLSIGLSGIYGTFLSISASQVFLFVVFGALLGVMKIDDFFYEAGKLTGRVFQGGPAQTAVVSSSLVGMVTGAAVANVAIVGNFTIPYMKRVGYQAETAGAIEATASTGGQIMPPVMGASAFLMASFLGVPYATVMLAGVIPAILYYWGCVLGVQFIAVKTGIRVPKEKVDGKLILRRLPLFAIPLALLIVMLLFQYSPDDAAFWTIVVAIALSYLGRETRPSMRNLLECITKGACVGAQIGVSLAVVGLIAQSLITTGLGTKIAGLVALLSGGYLIPALLITMVVAIILGCGVPTSAAYSIVAIVVVPGLVHMGVEPLSAHFFAFYFAVISALTPPVALAALAAAGIAQADYFKTSVQAFKLAISGFIIPFLVIYNPVVLMHPDNWVWAVGSAIAIPLGMTALTAAIYGCGLVPLSAKERWAAVVCTFCMFCYSMLRTIGYESLPYAALLLGMVVFVLTLMSQLRKKRSVREPIVAAAGALGTPR